MSSNNFCTSLTSFRVGHSNTFFIFSFSILIPSSPINTPENSTFLIFYLYFSSFTYKSFSVNLFTTFLTILLCFFSSFILTIILLMKLATFPVLIKLYKISFIIVWNISEELVSSKNKTIGSNNLFGAVNTIFHLSFSFIYTLL